MLNASHPVVCFGEVLWDILPTGAKPGGAPMNVAYHLKKLGVDPALITKVGLDSWGRKLINVLADAGLSTDHLQLDYKLPTGLVYASPNEQAEVTYDIALPSAWDFIEWEAGFATLMNEAKFFVYGSLASRNKDSRDTLYRLLDAATTKVLDVNLRPPNYRRTDVEYLLQKADILKVNTAELELITGWFPHFKSTGDRSKLLQDRFNLETVIVTAGGNGALVAHNGTVHRHEGIKVKVADTVGSGDAFLAGFLSQLLQDRDAEEALAFASAVGAFVATRSGACPLYGTAEIEALMKNGATVQS